MENEQPLLELADVHAFYGLAHILHGVSLEVRRGELVALLGRNGAGKTTTLRSIMGLARVGGGRIRFGGTALNGRPTEAIARLGIGYVPEDRRMFAGLTVEENLRLAALGARLGRARLNQAFERAWELFPELRQHAGRDAARLSGGQQQMVAIGRGVIGGSELLLIDEPTQGLAPNLATGIGRALADIARSGVGVLLVEQNAVVALELADRAYVIDQGAVKASGPADLIKEDREIRARYLAL
ncbi:MAG: ABC transporter ATP-binding protein [Carbonactinosporaceae bacterium]